MAGKQKKVTLVITAQNLASKAFAKVKNGLHSIADAAKSLFSPTGLIAGGIGGYGLAKISESFLDAARTTENYRVRLDGLLGSVKEGNALFSAMATYAGKVPFEYQDIMGAATQLAGVMKGGVDEIKQWMPMIGDLAASSGLGIQETTEQVIRMYSAGAASADLFRQRGILAMLGFQSGVKYTAEQTRQMLMDAWNDPASKFHGMTKNLATTWDGMLSMLKDAWFAFRNAVMNSGPFQGLKAIVHGMIDQVNQLQKSGKFNQIATDFGSKIVDGIKWGLKALPAAVSGILKGVEFLILAVSGWRQILAAAEILFRQIQIWSLDFINNLRLTFVGLMQGMNAIPGVNMKGAIASTYDDIGTSLGVMDQLQGKLDAAKLKLGQIQVGQDDTAAKFEATADSITASVKKIADDAWGKVDAAQKQAAEGVANFGKAATDSISQANAELDKYIAKVNEARAAGSGIPTSFTQSNYTDNLDASLKQAERTQ